MADDITLNANTTTGAKVAADDVSSVYYQRVKLTPGGDGAAAYGASNYRYLAAASTDEDKQLVKGSAGVLYGVTITNAASAARYVRLYNHVDAPTSADNADLFRTYAVPANGGIREEFPFGVIFTAGLGLRMTTDGGDTATTAVTAGDIHLMLEYV